MTWSMSLMEGSCLFLENIYEIRPVNGEKRAMGIWEHRRGEKKEKKKTVGKRCIFRQTWKGILGSVCVDRKRADFDKKVKTGSRGVTETWF